MLKALEVNSLFRKKIILFLILVVVLVVVLEIWAVNRLSDFGSRISKIEQTKQALKLENQVLANQLSQQLSLSKVLEEAKTLGFEKIKSIKYIVPPDLAYNKN